MNTHPRSAVSILLAFAALCSATTTAYPATTPVIVIDDAFDDDNATGSGSSPGFWNLQTMGGENGIYERNGFLNLVASGYPYTFACLNSKLDARLNFFRHTITITVLDILQNLEGVNPSEAFFRISINSTEKRQTASPQSISIRFCPGEVFLGYKTMVVGKADAENMQGDRVGSIWHQTYGGELTGFSLTLDPLAKPGSITCNVVLLTKSEAPVIAFSRVLEIPVQVWGADGDSALIMETRRNSPTKSETSYVSTSIGRLIVTSR